MRRWKSDPLGLLSMGGVGGIVQLMVQTRCGNHFGRHATLLVMAWLAVACGGSPTGVTAPPGVTAPATALSVSIASTVIQVGQTTAARASALDRNGAALAIGTPTWGTELPAIATVSVDGIVMGVAPGQTMVVALVNGVRGQASLTVVSVPVARIAITPSTSTLARGATIQLSASPLDSIGRPLTNRIVEWSSSDIAKAVVASNGVVTAMAPGVATITVAIEGIHASATLTITAPVGSVAAVILNRTEGTIATGDKLQLAATLRDDAGNVIADRAIAWSVMELTGRNVATVSPAGLVTAMSPGTVAITASSDGQSATATIYVTEKIDPTIVVSFGSPLENQVFGDTLRVVVTVRSALHVSDVVATVAGMPTVLAREPVGHFGAAEQWVAMIPITNIPPGTHLLVALATDSRGAHGLGFVQFVRDAQEGKVNTSPPHMK